jgi:hypothetical protein
MGKIKQNNIEVTKVIFRQFANGEVIALFPELPADNNFSNCMSYMRIGQHGTASCGIYDDTFKPYTGKIDALKAELERIGYNLKTVSRFSYAMDQKRIKAIWQVTSIA